MDRVLALPAALTFGLRHTATLLRWLPVWLPSSPSKISTWPLAGKAYPGHLPGNHRQGQARRTRRSGAGQAAHAGYQIAVHIDASLRATGVSTKGPSTAEWLTQSDIYS